MKKSTYNEMSKTAQGRHEVHEIMVKEVINRFESFINNAPAKNQDVLSKMLETFKGKVNNMGNGDMFLFLADETLSDRAFLGYVQDTIKGNI